MSIKQKCRNSLKLRHLQIFEVFVYSFYRVLHAEREGFEPPAPLSAAVFKTAVIDHSTISPIYLMIGLLVVGKRAPLKSDAKVYFFFYTRKFL